MSIAMLQEKFCTGCKRLLLVTEFYKNCRDKDGLAYFCKECVSYKSKEFRENNKEKIKLAKKQYSERNKRDYSIGRIEVPEGKECPKCKIWKSRCFYTVDRSRCDGISYFCKECASAYLAEQYKKHRVRRSQKEKLKRVSNPEKARNDRHAHYLRRMDHIKARVKAYSHAEENKEKIRNNKREYIKKRRKSDPFFKIICNLRGRINSLLKGKNKSERTMALLGCSSIDEIRSHLELFFYNNPCTGVEMTWENYGKGGWDIDHIIPVCWFDIAKPEEQKKAFHICNTQPMWEPWNSSKNSRHPGDIVWEDLYDAWRARKAQKE